MAVAARARAAPAVDRASSATLPRCCRSCSRGNAPIDIVTDQTSAHDPLSYLPVGHRARGLAPAGARRPRWFTTEARGVDGRPRQGDGRVQDAGCRGLRLRQLDPRRGPERRLRPGLRLPRLRAGVHPAAVLRRAGARSAGRRSPATRPTSRRPTGRSLDLFPENERLRRWITLAGERVAFQGLPARICWLGYGERHRAGLRFNEMVASGELNAPVVIGRDHLDGGSVASPYRETEAMPTARTRSRTGRCSTRW